MYTSESMMKPAYKNGLYTSKYDSYNFNPII